MNLDEMYEEMLKAAGAGLFNPPRTAKVEPNRSALLKMADGETREQAVARVKSKVQRAMMRLGARGWRGTLEIGQGKQRGGEVNRYRFTRAREETIGEWEINAPRALVRVAEEVLSDGD